MNKLTKKVLNSEYLPKLQYILNVMDSCITTKQADITLKWGKNYFKEMLNSKKFNDLSLSDYLKCRNVFNYYCEIINERHKKKTTVQIK